jgi:hypothetical protein
VVVLADTAQDQLARRLGAELARLGFSSEERELANGGGTPQTLVEVARQAGAVAAVRFVVSHSAMEVWVADRVTGKTVLEALPKGESGQSGSEALLALRAVELFRASLLEVDAPHASRGDVTPTEDIRRAVEPWRRTGGTWVFAASPAWGLSAGGVPSAAFGLLNASWQAAQDVSVDVLGMLSLSSPAVRGPEGVAQVAVDALGAGARWSHPFGSEEHAWTPFAGAGLFGVLVSMKGSANPGYLSTTAAVSTLAPYARAGLELRVMPHLSARVEGLIAVAIPRVEVQFAGRNVAAFGAPMGAVALGPTVDF